MVKLVLTAMEKTGSEAWPPLGLAYIASYLKKYLDFNNIIIVNKEKDPIRKILEQKPDIIGISAVTDEFPHAVALAKELKQKTDAQIWIGGHHISLLPKTLPDVFDLAVLYEGEETVLELMKLALAGKRLNATNLKNIKGIAYHDNGNVVVNERRELIKPIDKIPYPNRDLFKMEEDYLTPRRSYSIDKLTRATHMFTSRGCPYACVFCSSAMFWKRMIRFHSTDYVIGEINELINKYKVEAIMICDDLFASNKERLRDIVERIEKEGINKKVFFRIITRVDMIDEETCQLFKRMNAQDVTMGFESGSDKTLAYLKNNTTTVAQNQKAIDLCKKYDIGIHGYFMIGSPGETKEDMMLTYNFIKNNPIKSAVISVVTPYPGTPLWDFAKSKGMISDDMDWSLLNLHAEDPRFPLMTDTMPKEEFIEIYKMFTKLVESKTYNLKLKPKHLLSIKLWKRAIKSPRKTARYIYNIIKRKVRSN